MNGALGAPARMLFRAATLIFLVTIIIGILNGLDLWDPPRSLLLTHVHAGTLGWITLAVIGVALRMFGESADERAVRNGTRLAVAGIVATALYVVAFAIGTGVYRPATGTLMLAAVVWALVWVVGRWRHTPTTVPGVAMLLALASLVIGAVLGVLLGLFIANGSLPGLSTESASNLAGAHPPAMLVGYLVLAGTAVAEWLLVGRPLSRRAIRDVPRVRGAGPLDLPRLRAVERGGGRHLRRPGQAGGRGDAGVRRDVHRRRDPPGGALRAGPLRPGGRGGRAGRLRAGLSRTNPLLA